MASSGTYTFSLDLADVIDEAFARIGGESVTGADIVKARRSLNIMFNDWTNRGIPLWDLRLESQVLTAGEKTVVFDGANTVDLLDTAVRLSNSDGTFQDFGIERISLQTYLLIPQKDQPGRPASYYVNRQRDTTEVTIWPVPDVNGTYSLLYWRMVYFQDGGEFTNTPDINRRFYPPLVSGLAYYLGLKSPAMLKISADQRMGILKMLKDTYEEELARAFEEDRERASFIITPNFRRRR